MIGELLTAIKSKLNGTALWNDVEGRIFWKEAPAGTLIYPYVVYSLISDAASWTFTESFEDIPFQFSLFSASTDEAEISKMYDDLRAAFSTTVNGKQVDECQLMVTGATMLWMRRENLVAMTEDIAQLDGSSSSVTHWAVDYGILQEAA